MSEEIELASPGARAGTGGEGTESGVDPGAWLDAHGDALFRFAFARLRDRGEAEEAVQECLFAALHARSNFAARSSERTWLVSILKHKLVDRFRRRAAAPDHVPNVEEQVFDHRGLWKYAPRPWHSDPIAAAQECDFRRVLDECMHRLPAILRDVFVLREIDELDGRRVGELLEITPTTVWQRLHRARLSLRACLENHWFNPPKQRRGTGR